MAILGVMVFPIKSNSVDINILLMVINIFNDPQRFSLVPMILTEVLRSMIACIRGHNFFGGCSMLLQIWAREHFYRRDPQMDFYMGARNRIEIHEDRLQNWMGAPTGREELRAFLNNLIGDAIQWKFSWIRGVVLARTDKKSTSRVGIHDRFGNRRKKWCTPEYYAWQNTVSHMAHPSVHGHSGFVDNQHIDWIRESVLPRMGFTASMYNQIVPGSIDYLIQVVEEEEEEEDPEEDPEEDSKENPEEDPKEDPEEDPDEDPEEEVEEDHMEVSETGSNIYDPRDGGVIDMSPKHGPDGSPEYHPEPFYDGDDDGDDAPTRP
ncbi:uncharacterized protein [Solanum tuberosum]|uniref:uncharacterized protein n=1 Tax=Solanum tuberosum TaxID=4113 RepID=UPI00073A500A|nr:PREDICTED: uncharacterized protein LOC107063504 [Solanum tuberosum]